ncbi:MAG: cupin-like domain-containing protein [Sphingomonas sp.]|uniref:cupin-like domain-containing protein n=1 Tax=Sphingomonas sp. TaxID=28214 RepID=UPI002272E6A9|nr:cupin-like domain-containing protein [Sphingomonas sp.]MCX8477781.1 cupin-like domain-containing protein [Sphingomonas sp.]
MTLPTPQPVREWRDVDRTRFREEIVPLGQPALLRGLVRDWPAVQAESIARYLRGFDLSRNCEVLIGSPTSGGRFFYGDDFGVMNFQKRDAALGALVDRLEQAMTEAQPPMLAAQALVLPQVLPGFAAENRLDLVDHDVPPRMWIGTRAVVACHYDTMRNLACVAAGRRRFTLFPPDQVRNLYVGPYEATPAGTPVSLVDFDAPDLARFPLFPQALAAAQLAELEPGDALYIPYMWWHHVRALDGLNVLVNYWWNEAADATLAPLDSFIHGLLALRNLPDEQRAAWRAMFEHFVFRANGDPVAHLPEANRGVLGGMPPAQARMLAAQLGKMLAAKGG